MEGIIDLHHDLMFFLILIIILVTFLLYEFINYNLNINVSIDTNFINSIFLLPTKVQHNTVLEIIWTLIPCFILLLIAIPSFSLLYIIEDLSVIEGTIKVIGNQ